MSMPPLPATSADWCRHFVLNRDAPRDIPWGDPRRLSRAEAWAVGPSIAIFQRGESGTGRRFFARADAYAAAAGDPAYGDAVRLFVAEERRHAAELARFLEREGLPAVAADASDGVFRRLRGGAGLATMIAVLLTAEMIATIYYRALARATGSAVLRALCRCILRDEAAHVLFQAGQLGRLRRDRPAPRRRLAVACHRAFLAATCHAIWSDHAAVLAAAGYRPATFRTDCLRVFDRHRAPMAGDALPAGPDADGRRTTKRPGAVSDGARPSLAVTRTAR